MAPQDALTASRRTKAFNSYIQGKKDIVSLRSAEIFLEACCHENSPSESLELICFSKAGVEAVRKSVRVQSTPEFLCKHVCPFFSYILHPSCQALLEGALVQKIVQAMVEPPTMFRSLLKHYEEDTFLDKTASTQGFASLCLEIVRFPGTILDSTVLALKPILAHRDLVSHSDPAVRDFGYQIKRIFDVKESNRTYVSSLEDGPGGRHDNDFTDFHQISIYPTTNEFSSIRRPFFRLASQVADLEPKLRKEAHLDNQFRLLREDMIAELRVDVAVAMEKTKPKRHVQVLRGLWPVGIDTGVVKKVKPATISVTVASGLEPLKKLQGYEEKQAFLKNNKDFLRHNSFGAFCSNGRVLGFGSLVRNENKLCSDPPVVDFTITGQHLVREIFTLARIASEVLNFVMVDTPVFAYEPILKRLQKIGHLPLGKEILHLDAIFSTKDTDFFPTVPVSRFIDSCSDFDKDGVVEEVEVREYNVTLDRAQLDALLYSLASPLSLIQGPPGTGKSFIGALAARILLGDPSFRLMILSYTNHALDQFLEDLMNCGIKTELMVRLGSKSTPATAKLSFELQYRASKHRHNSSRFSRSFDLEAEADELSTQIEDMTGRIMNEISYQDIVTWLEYSDDIQSELFIQAFKIPTSEDGFTIAGKNGQPLKEDFLFRHWRQGQGPGKFRAYLPSETLLIWNMSRDQRTDHYSKWTKAIHSERLDVLVDRLERLDELQRDIDRIFHEGRCDFIRTKRIIGCTTTAAAMHSSLLHAAEADCILVEEAGEILEAHILTALTSSTKQLILIGDHQQLRPKCNSYDLSVEKGEGYDLNRSMFERLILRGHKHVTLKRQHRMVPEISQLIRKMTYPELLDGQKTLSRPRIRGVDARVVWLNHEYGEDVDSRLKDRRLSTEKGSKQNKFEAEMVLKIVKYLGQQGYKSEQMVVLTPYLGQLRLLRDKLSHENDPSLSDLDSSELIRAGLLSRAAGGVHKQSIRLSTIDNYQGEEADIVIASMTRGNYHGDIGFMSANERLNVLVSRARNCLIMIGNSQTFMASKKGSIVWTPFFESLKKNGYLQDGLSVRCEQHPDVTFSLSLPEHFEQNCPDGGCSKTCGAALPCGLHKCIRKCHRLKDHSKTACDQMIKMTCVKQHPSEVTCSQRNDGCKICQKEEETIRRRLRQSLQVEKQRQLREAGYKAELDAINDEIAAEKLARTMAEELKSQKQGLEDAKKELMNLKDTKERQRLINERELKSKTPVDKTSAGKSVGVTQSTDPSTAHGEWELQKRDELASNKAIDELMAMIGLEEVKREFLSIKSAVDTAIRQGTSMSKSRYSCSLLGNPGTGKTTVARLYAQFLTSMAVIPGNAFQETTGAKLANDGVGGAQKLIDGVMNDGGGVIFVDEAYQLSSGNSQGGKAVMDFLLAEVENLRGKIVFILAGYSRLMENFFAHNPGLPSRFPITMKFEDYTDQELLQILEMKINAKYKQKMKAEDGLNGLYARIVSRRIGRGRNREGFGNAREVENMLERISKRQATRLQRQRRARLRPDDFLFTKEDLIGPEPNNALRNSEGWEKLNKLIGLKEVKESVQALVDTIQTNYYRELKEHKPIDFNLNKVFFGSPGTGKTTVAKLYGQILVDLGLLSNGEVIIRNPSDFVGAHIGHSEQQTKGILNACVGKVLVIDEAYGLYGGLASSGGGNGGDVFRTAVIDTIVAEVQSVAGEDRCVLLLGYRDQMEEMFQNVNPGLARRFPIATGFSFEDFTQAEMSLILDLKLDHQGFKINLKGRQVVLDMLGRARNRPNFGNAGEVDILLNEAKLRHQKRLSAKATVSESTLEPHDFDENFERLEKSENSVSQLFKDTIGCEQIIEILQGYQDSARTSKELGLNPKENIGFNFLFRGPPGTGKTTTARHMGQIFYEMGFLANAEVIDASASDLVGQFVGQTGPKVRQLLDKALGRVLLIDEAYRLAQGHFSKEALDEIVDAVTKEKYHKRLIIILAGYEKDINHLLMANSGLSSRFPAVIDFHGLDPASCFKLLTKRLTDEMTRLEASGKGTLQIDCLTSPNQTFVAQVEDLFGKLSQQEAWASARDIGTLASALFNALLRTISKKRDPNPVLLLTEDLVLAQLNEVFAERSKRAQSAYLSNGRALSFPESMRCDQATSEDSKLSSDSTSPKPRRCEEQALTDEDENFSDSTDVESPACSTPLPDKAGIELKKPPQYGPQRAPRDTGVSDEVWNQLQKDIDAAQERERDYATKLKAKREAVDIETRERILRELVEEEERRKEEEEARKRLEGKCPMGYDWIQQQGGWRCAGGSHFVPDENL